MPKNENPETPEIKTELSKSENTHCEQVPILELCPEHIECLEKVL